MQPKNSRKRDTCKDVKREPGFELSEELRLKVSGSKTTLVVGVQGIEPRSDSFLVAPWQF